MNTRKYILKQIAHKLFQGPITAEEVNFMLKAKSMEDKFPLFTAIHRICTGQIKPDQMIDCIRSHPEHM